MGQIKIKPDKVDTDVLLMVAVNLIDRAMWQEQIDPKEGISEYSAGYHRATLYAARLATVRGIVEKRFRMPEVTKLFGDDILHVPIPYKEEFGELFEAVYQAIVEHILKATDEQPQEINPQ